jgi:hypothetical protein
MRRVSPHACLITILFALAILLALFPFARAVENKEAHVTVVVRDVRLLPPHIAARAVALNETVRPGTAVRTGTESRAELTFTNATITRLGANTIFSFSEEAKTIDLDSGTILLQVPKSAGKIKINMPVASVAVTGFTALFSTGHNAYSKIIIVEGKACVSRRHAQAGAPCVKLFPGDEFIIRPDGSFPPNAVHINLEKITQGPLFTRFPPLPEWNLIWNEVRNQQNNPPPGGLADLTNQDALDQNIAAHPMPTPRPARSQPRETLKTDAVTTGSQPRDTTTTVRPPPAPPAAAAAAAPAPPPP